MRHSSFFWLLVPFLVAGCSPERPQYASFDDYPVPNSPIEELTYSPKSSIFRVWSPAADSAKLRLYGQGLGGESLRTIAMKWKPDGLWQTEEKGDLGGQFYTFSIYQDGQWMEETPGIFAKAVGVNGKRGAIIRLSETDPAGWENDRKPEFQNLADAIVYEMHWRDFTISETSGLKNRGKFLSLTESGASNTDGLASGIEHLKELGVTHIHILPSYDYSTVDESRPDSAQYNWGYDPLNYNVPEGSYSTNAIDPACRIREFKEMVMACHKAGIRVVLDVVYNHTVDIEGSGFHRTAPGYFHRKREDGTWGDASGCSNETASERPMMRKFMLESVAYWMKEYHIDGFRFDLMGIHDLETMQQIQEMASQIDPNVLIYGEGWAAEAPQYPTEQLAMKANTHRLTGIAAFCDEMRDGLRGPFSDDEQPAFLAAIPGHEQSIRFGIVGCIDHPEVDMSRVNYSDTAWTREPQQMISYVSCHDDMCLVDRLKASIPQLRKVGSKGLSRTQQDLLIRLNKLAQTAVFTSQGIPFLFAGEEVLRDKQGVHNSYNSPDAINAIDWRLKAKNLSVFEYYRSLIAMRKAHKAFRMGSADLVRQAVRFLQTPDCVVAYTIDGSVVNDPWGQIVVVLNANPRPVSVNLPKGNYTVVCRDGRINLNGMGKQKGGKVLVAAQSALILHQ